MKVKYILLCFLCSIFLFAGYGFNSLFALLGIFLFILGIILILLKIDKTTNK